MMQTEILIVGGGIIGLSLARELARRFPGAAIALIEKEAEVARHASGRNSGVLHAGFYYSADSLKARLTRDGNRALTDYCLEHGLPSTAAAKWWWRRRRRRSRASMN
jgi:L-2-hydroxyglutarate oxidase LhgO